MESRLLLVALVILWARQGVWEEEKESGGLVEGGRVCLIRGLTWMCGGQG